MLYERLHRLLSALGARPAAIDADAHDRMMAQVSAPAPRARERARLPGRPGARRRERAPARHGAELPRRHPGRGRRTRAIWTDIYLSNRDALTAGIDEAIAALAEVRDTLAGGDAEAIAAWNDRAREDRRRLLEVDAAGGTVHELRVPVPNRPGVIAELALALGRAGVNIADMALYPAPDLSEGLVALWIAGDDAAARAAELIAELGFPVTGRRRERALRAVGRAAGHARAARRQVDLAPQRAAGGDLLGARGDPQLPGRGRHERDARGAAHARRDRRGAAGRARRPRDRPARGGGADRRAIDVGNSGTLMRLLPGWLAAQPGMAWTLDGDESIRAPPGRPHRRAAAAHGRPDRGDRWPLPALHDPTAARLEGIEYALPVPSAQVKSCVLLAGLAAAGDTQVIEEIISRDHTERALLRAGVTISRAGGRVTVCGIDELELDALSVPGDLSSAAFLVTAAILVPGSRIVLENVGVNWTRDRLPARSSSAWAASSSASSRSAARSSRPTSPSPTSTSPRGRSSARPSRPRRSRWRSTSCRSSRCSAASPRARPSCAAPQELRLKETDRIAGVVEGLRGLGARHRGDRGRLRGDRLSRWPAGRDDRRPRRPPARDAGRRRRPRVARGRRGRRGWRPPRSPIPASPTTWRRARVRVPFMPFCSWWSFGQ